MTLTVCISIVIMYSGIYNDFWGSGGGFDKGRQEPVRGGADKMQKHDKMHEQFMNKAYIEAVKAYKKNEAPVGAVIVKDGEIISRGHNERESKKDPTLHAEITAIRKASRKLESWRLAGCDMYVTLEPCAMCAGALIQARIRRLYIGAPDPKAGAAGSVLNIFDTDGFNHKVEVFSGILEDKCSLILKQFFKEIRHAKIKKAENPG